MNKLQQFLGILIVVLLFNCGSLAAFETKSAEYIWFKYYVKSNHTAVYSEPQQGSKIVGYLEKGYTLVFKSPKDAPKKWGKEGWVHFPGYATKPIWMDSELPVGWVKYQALISAEAFKLVNKWPYRHIIEDTLFFRKVSCFKNSGAESSRIEDADEYSERTYQDLQQLVNYSSQVYTFDDIVISRDSHGGYSAAMAIIDRAHNRLCPPGYTESRCDKLYEDTGGYHWEIGLFSDGSESMAKKDNALCARIGRPN